MRDVTTNTTKETGIGVVFFGTPAFAVPALHRLAIDPAYDVRLVVTQPDRPAGRGRRLTASAVKEAANELGIPVYQPASLRTPELRAPLVAVAAELFVVAAYGLIFGPKTLEIPRLGCVNIHASLLPAYRGASPISAAILNGDATAGVSLMLMETGLDTGPVIATAAAPVDVRDTTDSLTRRLAALGAELVGDRLHAFASGELSPMPQSETVASLTRPLAKADGWLEWTCPARDLERQVRAMWPWPRAWTALNGEPFQLHASSVVAVPEDAPPESLGTLFRLGLRAAVACGNDCLALDRVQLPGGRPISGEALLSGYPHLEGVLLGEGVAPPKTSGPLVVPL